MEYNLIKINELGSYADFGAIVDDSLLVVEIKDGAGKWITAKARVDELFSTRNIKLVNASLYSAQLGPIAQELGLGDRMTSQEDFNKFVGTMISLLFDKLNNKPDIILHPGPTQPDPVTEINRLQFVEGTLWIDTSNYRVYVYRMVPDSTGALNDVPTWVGLTDR